MAVDLEHRMPETQGRAALRQLQRRVSPQQCWQSMSLPGMNEQRDWNARQLYLIGETINSRMRWHCLCALSFDDQNNGVMPMTNSLHVRAAASFDS